jgi:hypothetical protein
MSATTVTPMKAIRAKCIDCAGGSEKEVRECRILSCALWPYRMGKRPATLAKHRRRNTNSQRKGTDESNDQEETTQERRSVVVDPPTGTAAHGQA